MQMALLGSGMPTVNTAPARNMVAQLRARSSRRPVTTPRRTEVRVSSRGPTLRIDGTATRAAMNIRTNRGFLNYRKSVYQRAADAAIRRIAAEGSRLAAIESPGNTVANVAGHRGERTGPAQIDIRALPAPKVSIQPKRVSVDTAEAGGPNGTYRREVQLSFRPRGSVSPLSSGTLFDTLG
ncbi:MAG: hypothetical protein GF320_07240 [Armatimonadia bacterium]|nr:hypothetical protein [Armatimonadia bacterium]